MTEKRFQVFVSSTYVDLVEERREVMQALLELDCIPAGMEAFVATDETQWELITEVIDLSDYYVLIVGGRYGSTTAEGISYTEKEFDYAKAHGIPILAFVHANPDDIPRGLADKDADPAVSIEKQIKLGDFRARAMTGRTVKTFSSSSELGSVVSRSLIRLIKKNPGTGWVRGDQAMTVQQQEEALAMREEIAELKALLDRGEIDASQDQLDYQQGSDPVRIGFFMQDPILPMSTRKEVDVDTTWDKVFSSIGPAMLDEESEMRLRASLSADLYIQASRLDDSLPSVSDIEDYRVEVFDNDWADIIIQFRALGFVTNGEKKRGVNDTGKYLRLTEKGDAHLVRLRAKRRSDSSSHSNQTDEPPAPAIPAGPTPGSEA